jgi:hypothetical protein
MKRRYKSEKRSRGGKRGKLLPLLPLLPLLVTQYCSVKGKRGKGKGIISYLRSPLTFSQTQLINQNAYPNSIDSLLITRYSLLITCYLLPSID